MTPDLKPCPFCGGKAVVWFNDNGDTPRSWFWDVHCDDCDARQTNYERNPTDGGKNVAIAAWNRRAPCPDCRRKDEALESAKEREMAHVKAVGESSEVLLRERDEAKEKAVYWRIQADALKKKLDSVNDAWRRRLEHSEAELDTLKANWPTVKDGIRRYQECKRNLRESLIHLRHLHESFTRKLSIGSIDNMREGRIPTKQWESIGRFLALSPAPASEEGEEKPTALQNLYARAREWEAWKSGQAGPDDAVEIALSEAIAEVGSQENR